MLSVLRRGSVVVDSGPSFVELLSALSSFANGRTHTRINPIDLGLMGHATLKLIEFEMQAIATNRVIIKGSVDIINDIHSNFNKSLQFISTKQMPQAIRIRVMENLLCFDASQGGRSRSVGVITLHAS